jgi:BA14K-like protein
LKKIFALIAAGTVFTFGASIAQATPQDYCAAYARDFADQGTAAKWQTRNDQALADCLFVTLPAETQSRQAPKPKPVQIAKLQQPSPAVAPPPKKKIEKRSKPILQEGSIAWLDYCEKKYASFDRKAGTYKSYTGVERKCLVTAN